MVDNTAVQVLQGILHAYVQRFAPGLSGDDLLSTIEAIIPLVFDGSVTKAEALILVQQVASVFNLRLALTQSIQPEYLKLAQELALCMAQKPMEEAVKETVVAYIKKYEQTLESVGENLIESAIAAIVKGEVEFDWQTELNLEDKKLLIKQVSFKLNIMQADPIPCKAAQEIAAQIYGEVERFRTERQAALGSTDISKGLLEPDSLEISSIWMGTPPEEG
ncbi:hypothetical protein [Pseudanabaena sp. FACHB-2040]|uniref:hypothetical protein n=1 Tax=Pseudanabaena sp. FACHB-2040 TaxID=2692859 RepID=UPI001687AAF5|nr:hypothetical protein [Pseudanabaena sp. FACHB-2040]MBD2260528.1 hypothetical protein [Pseudanabaena sp. FACHB-2040]